MTKHTDEPPMRTDDLNYPETLRLTLRDAASMFDEALDTAAAIENGEDVQPEATRAFQDINDLRELLTDRRIAILRSIYEQPADSISALADRLDRTYSLVHDDVTILAKHDIVQFRDGPRGAKQLYVPYETIRVDIPLVGSPVTADTLDIDQDAREGPDTDRDGAGAGTEKDRWFENATDPRGESHS